MPQAMEEGREGAAVGLVDQSPDPLLHEVAGLVVEMQSAALAKQTREEPELGVGQRSGGRIVLEHARPTLRTV